MITQKDGRRNRHQIQAHLPVSEPGTGEPAVREVVALFARTGPVKTARWLRKRGPAGRFLLLTSYISVGRCMAVTTYL